MKRLLVVVAALAGCKQADDRPAPAPPVAVASGAPPRACDELELVRASQILAESSHPCRAAVDAAYGRLLRTGIAYSGTVTSTRPARGAGLVITCQHCTGAGGDGLHEPERDEPSTFQVQAPARHAAGRITSGKPNQLFFVYRLFSPLPPKAAFNAKGQLEHILPEHDFVVGVLAGTPIEVVGHLGVLPAPIVSDAKLALHDPRALAHAQPAWADAQPGTRALVLGFPRDLPDKQFGGELVVSVGEILDDARAKDMLARSDPDEAAIPYDPAVEMIVAARAASGMSGGGTFDTEGRYLGVNVRGTLKPVDGKYLVRVVRAPYVMKQVETALAGARAPLRTKLAPFLP